MSLVKMSVISQARTMVKLKLMGKVYEGKDGTCSTIFVTIQ
jgi:hypothetical protein